MVHFLIFIIPISYNRMRNYYTFKISPVYDNKSFPGALLLFLWENGFLFKEMICFSQHKIHTFIYFFLVCLLSFKRGEVYCSNVPSQQSLCFFGLYVYFFLLRDMEIHFWNCKLVVKLMCSGQFNYCSSAGLLCLDNLKQFVFLYLEVSH